MCSENVPLAAGAPRLLASSSSPVIRELLQSEHVSIRPHTSAYVRIRQHATVYVRTPRLLASRSTCVIHELHQHTSAYVSIRQHTSDVKLSSYPPLGIKKFKIEEYSNKIAFIR